MLGSLLVACALYQPSAPQTPAPTPAAQQSEPKAKAEPTPLDKAGAKGVTNRLLGRGPGAYLTAKRLLEWAGAEQTDAEAAKRIWAQWEAEAKPGYDAIIAEFARRTGSTPKQAEAVLTEQLAPSIEKLKEKFTPDALHAMVAQNTIGIRQQPAMAVSWLYMFDPGRGGDDMKLVSAGKTRKVKAKLNETGGTGAALEFSVPMSWGVATDKPGAFVIGENGGLGPLTIAVNALALPKEAEHDPLKMASRMTASGKEHGEAASSTFAGKPAGRVWVRVSQAIEQEILCCRFDYFVVIENERMVSIAVTVGGNVTPQQREYTTAELAAYAESRKAVIDWLMGTFAFADTPVETPAPPAPPAAPAPSVK